MKSAIVKKLLFIDGIIINSGEHINQLIVSVYRHQDSPLVSNRTHSIPGFTYSVNRKRPWPHPRTHINVHWLKGR